MPEIAPASHQTARLGVGRHDGPGSVVCIMELASMLAGERFSDHPVSVCPIVGALLRAYNDIIDDDRRGDLYRYAAESVGTRGDYCLQYRRARAVIAWAGERYEQRGRVAGALRRRPQEPLTDGGPDEIAYYLIGTLGRRQSDELHAEVLALIDRLIAMGYESEAVEWPAAVPERVEAGLPERVEAGLPERVEAGLPVLCAA